MVSFSKKAKEQDFNLLLKTWKNAVSSYSGSETFAAFLGSETILVAIYM